MVIRVMIWPIRNLLMVRLVRMNASTLYTWKALHIILNVHVSIPLKPFLCATGNFKDGWAKFDKVFISKLLLNFFLTNPVHKEMTMTIHLCVANVCTEIYIWKIRQITIKYYRTEVPPKPRLKLLSMVWQLLFQSWDQKNPT